MFKAWKRELRDCFYYVDINTILHKKECGHDEVKLRSGHQEAIDIMQKMHAIVRKYEIMIEQTTTPFEFPEEAIQILPFLEWNTRKWNIAQDSLNGRYFLIDMNQPMQPNYLYLRSQ